MGVRVDAQKGALGGTGIEWEQDHSRKFAWVREIRPLIEGDVTTPFTRVRASLDAEPIAGRRVRLASDGHQGSDGVASGAATLFDRHGPIGSSIAVALAQPAEAFRPPRHIGLR